MSSSNKYVISSIEKHKVEGGSGRDRQLRKKV